VIASQSIVSPSSPPKKSVEGFLGPKNSSAGKFIQKNFPHRKSKRFSCEGIFRNPRQTPHFSVEYKSEGFGDVQNALYRTLSILMDRK
jgi:hypothetical protein